MKNVKNKNTDLGNGAPAAQTGKNGQPAISAHLAVPKTYKLYIGGKFPRTESGRFYKIKNAGGKLIANVCQGSRKDFRMAVVAARAAQSGWAKRSAYNRGQILYRIAEMLEGRKAQFVEELQWLGASPNEAVAEVVATIDRLVYYAGWADKYQQVFSAVNPVASSHFNFSVLEPMGVVAVFAPEKHGLLGLVSAAIPAICGGNTVVVLASNDQATVAMSLAEVLHTSDLPGGVLNILTGSREELIGHFSTHKDVNAMIYCGQDEKDIASVRENSIENLKRVVDYHFEDWNDENAESPYFISDVQEVKTTWHPVGV